MLKFAFKEWAVICHALAEGRQALILRKGGISEVGGTFAVKHRRFWLFPTYTHQQREGIQADAQDLLERVEKDKPADDMIRLAHFAEITGLYHIKELLPAMMLSHMHIWSAATVEKRFHYREPGLFVLPVRVYRGAEPGELPNTPEYEGCRSWVELDCELSTANAEPVLSEGDMDDVQANLDMLLNPTRLA